MAVNILTTDDLQKFKEEFFMEFRQVVGRQQKTEPLKQREWLRTKEVCKMLGISLSKLQYMRDNGDIKFTRIGGTLFYSLEEINKLLSAGSNQTKAF
ncbi:MAG: helix-turn-helix domain-containing protein [Bacteroidia bacterium]|nr:helix-turn-helix domain-containing protein [Bacteroidia bacterium]